MEMNNEEPKIKLINAILNKDYKVINKTPYKAFDKSIINLLMKNDIDPNLIELDNEYISVFRALKGKSYFIQEVFNDIDLFNMVIEYASNNNDYNSRLIRGLINKDYKLFFSSKDFRIFDFNVIDKIINMGLTDIDFFKYCINLNYNTGLIYGLIRHGYYKLSMFLDDNYSDYITFDDFLEVGKYRTMVLNFNLFKFFMKKESGNVIKFFNSPFPDGIINYLLENRNKIDDELLNNQVFINTLIIYTESNFKSVLLILKDKNLNKFPFEYQNLYNSAYNLLKNTNKLNTLEMNPNISYKLIKKVYPIMGEEFALELIKYDSAATNNIIKLIDDGNGFIVKTAYEYMKKYNLFDNTISPIHYTFRNIDRMTNLFTDLSRIKTTLDEETINSLKSIILNGNIHNINTYKELINYKKTLYQKALELKTGLGLVDLTINGVTIKNDLVDESILRTTLSSFIQSIFGIRIYGKESLVSCINEYHFDDFSLYSELLKEIKSKNIDISDIMITKKDVMLIEIIKKVSEYNIPSQELIDVLNKLMQGNEIEDYTLWLDSYHRKLRKLYSRYMDSKLTNPLDIKGKQKNIDGVKVIEYEGGNFDFLVHTINDYDGSVRTFKKSLLEDPSLWTKLEGVTTISTSSISDKNVRLLNSKDDKVIYLFSDIPDDFMLYMGNDDILTEHGTHHLEPIAYDNDYVDLRTLNQRTVINGSLYNEISGFREGMIPTAILCVDREITPLQIKHAKYFSELLGREVPIIKMDLDRIEIKNRLRYREICNMFFENKDFVVTKELIDEYLYNGDVLNDDSLITFTSNICTKLKENLNTQKITPKEYLILINYTKKVVNRIYSGVSKDKDYLRDFNKLVACIFSTYREKPYLLEESKGSNYGK